MLCRRALVVPQLPAIGRLNPYGGSKGVVHQSATLLYLSRAVSEQCDFRPEPDDCELVRGDRGMKFNRRKVLDDRLSIVVSPGASDLVEVRM